MTRRPKHLDIVSWNVFRDNSELSNDVSQLLGKQPSIICMQEFPQELTPTLHLHDHYKAYHADECYLHKRHGKSVRLHNLILTNLPVVRHAVIKHEALPRKPLRYINYEEVRTESLYIDVLYNGREYRVFNVHFECVTSPEIRLKRLSEIARHFAPHNHNIICGDFNNFGRFWVNIMIWWLFGNYTFKGLFINEKKHFKRSISRLNMTNYFHNVNTYKTFPNQLDYILVPNSFKVVDSGVIGMPHSSDHEPIYLSIA